MLIQSVIDDSDYYLLVVGGRYGTTDPDGVSYTEREYDYAVVKGLPVLAFIHENPADIASGKTDQSDALAGKLEHFVAKIKGSKHVKFWKNADDLKAKVI